MPTDADTVRIAVLEADLAALRRELTIRTDAAKEAVLKAESATERRFDGVNEFRKALTDQTATFLPRETFDSTVASWTLWRDAVEHWRAENSGQQSGSNAITARIFNVLSIVAAFAAVIVVVISH